MVRRSFVLVAVLMLACGDDEPAPTVDGGTQHPGTHDASVSELDAGTIQHDAAADSGPAVTMDAGSDDFGGSDVCSACLDRECSAESRNCRDEAACAALVDCARACGSAAAADCRATCVDESPTGVVPYNDLVLCMGQRCRAECPFVAQ